MNEIKRNWFMVGTKGSRACLLLSVKVTFVRKLGIRFMSVVRLIFFFLSKGLQYVLCLCGLM